MCIYLAQTDLDFFGTVYLQVVLCGHYIYNIKLF